MPPNIPQRTPLLHFPQDLLKLGESEITSCQDNVTEVDWLEDKLYRPHQVPKAHCQRQLCRSQGIST